MKRAQLKRKRPFEFSEWHAHDVCDFIEKLHHIEGKWDLPTIVLDPFQVLFLVQLFGFRTIGNPDIRRYSQAMLAVGRKNGKSALASGILLYVLCCEGEPGPQIYTAAPTYDKASIVWRVSKIMIEKDRELAEAFGLEPMAKAIVQHTTSGFYKPIHSKASTQDGLNPSAVCLDEVHGLPNPDLLNVLRSASGARDNPLYLYVTTEGYTNAGPWPDQRDFMKKVLEGVVEADHYLGVLYVIDDADEELDPTVWIKANPLLVSNPRLLKRIQEEALEAAHKPSTMAEFRTKRCNRPSAGAAAWVDLAKWKRCSAHVDDAELVGWPCWAALDLSSTTDTTAAAVVWRLNGAWAARVYFWTPESAVATRSTRGTIQYSGWVESGHIRTTPGEVVDLERVESDLRQILSPHDVVCIAYDPWRATEIVQRLAAEDDEEGHDGYSMVQFPQQPKYYQPAIDELEKAYLSKKLAHSGNPVLHWHASNLILRTDVNNNGAPDKRRSAEKIDGMVALLMAIGAALTEEPTGPSVYESRGILSV
jgi:phage terminase large subunit-like protein